MINFTEYSDKSVSLDLMEWMKRSFEELKQSDNKKNIANLLHKWNSIHIFALYKMFNTLKLKLVL